MSGEYEADLLYVKLICERPSVDKWILIESNSDFRGNPKPLCVDKILKQPRFAPYLSRIHVISNTDKLFEDNWPKAELGYFQAEFRSRGLCFDYLKENFRDDDWVIMTDIDEYLDFADPTRRKILNSYFDEFSESIQIQNLKYWWQPNCLNLDPLKYIPAHPLGVLKERPHPFHHRNNHCKRLENGNYPLAFELAYCFDFNGLWSKCTTFAHDRYEEENIQNGLAACSFHKRTQIGENFDSVYDWFEVIELNETNSCKYVREHLDELNPNTVSKDYSIWRVMNGLNPHPCEQHSLMRGNKIDKRYHHYRRNK